MTKKQAYSDQTKEQFKQIILETVKKQKPETIQQLIKQVKEKTSLSAEEITQILIQLENEDKVHFTKKEIMIASTLKVYVFSKQAAWYWITITLALATAVTVLTVPDNTYPIIYARSVLGVVFLLFLPGFTLIKTLYPSKLPIQTSSENLDTIERVALSLALSISLVPLVAFILNYTPWGIRLAPITLSLLAFTAVSATVAVLREHQVKTPQNQH